MKKLEEMKFKSVDNTDFNIFDEPTIIMYNTICLSDGRILQVDESYLNLDLVCQHLEFKLKNIIIYEQDNVYINILGNIHKVKVSNIYLKE